MAVAICRGEHDPRREPLLAALPGRALADRRARRHRDRHPVAVRGYVGLSAGLISAAIAMRLPGAGSIYVSQSLQFRRPVRLGDTITARVEVTALAPERRRITLATTCSNQRGEVVTEGEAVVMLDASNER